MRGDALNFFFSFQALTERTVGNLKEILINISNIYVHMEHSNLSTSLSLTQPVIAILIIRNSFSLSFLQKLFVCKMKLAPLSTLKYH